MKKYFIITIISLFIGYVMAKIIFIEYKSESVMSLGNTYYFLIKGTYPSYDDMVSSSSKIGKYIYIYEDKSYKVFTCISKDKKNIDKALEHFGGEIKKYTISDNILESIIEENDANFGDITSSCEKSLEKYKEG